MALPSSGSISLSQVNTELGVSATATRSLGETTTRNLFGVASGAISMSNGYGKANQFAFTISSNQTNANLATLATNAGWNGSSKVVATIGSGVLISSNSTGTAALTIPPSFPGGVELINNGTIVGMGGNGGAGGNADAWYSYSNPGSPGASGGTALSVSTSTTITNNGTLAGGGGGGGGGSAWDAYVYDGYSGFYMWKDGAGGGGGGGRSSYAANSSGGSGGYARKFNRTGGAGGTGYSSAAGGGGSGNNAAAGGGGGTWGASGTAGGNYSKSGGAAGGGGAAVSGNSYVTWAATGTRMGGLV